MWKRVKPCATFRECTQIEERCLGHRLWKEQRARRESDAGRVQGRGQGMIGAEGTRREHAAMAARASLTQKQLERAHLVAAVNSRGQVVTLDPSVALARPQFTRDSLE